MALLWCDDYILHYERAGTGFPLLLLPGAAGDGTMWWRTGWVEKLATSFDCVVIDPPGMGGSGTPGRAEAYAVEVIANDVLALADALGFERFAVWGASAGGGDAIVLAVTNPQRVAALITSGWWPRDDFSAGRAGLRQLATEIRARGTKSVLGTLCAAEGIEPPEWMRAIDPSREVVASILDGLVPYPWETHARPAQIRVPTLLIVGEREDPAGEAAVAAKQMPQAEICVLPGRGHIGGWPFAPADSIAAAQPFLERTAA